MTYTLYDATVTPCAQQLGALADIIDKAAVHCTANKIEESALLQDRLYPDMFCLARQIRQSADFGMNTGARLAGVTSPALPAVDDTSLADAKNRVETALAFVKTLPRQQVDGAEDKTIAWTAGGNERKMRGRDYYLQQFALPNFYFFVTPAYEISRHRGVQVGKRDFLGPVVSPIVPGDGLAPRRPLAYRPPKLLPLRRLLSRLYHRGEGTDLPRHGGHSPQCVAKLAAK